MPNKRTMLDIEVIALRTTLSRELCQFQEKINQITRDAATANASPAFKDSLTQDAANLEVHAVVLRTALADLV